MNPHDVVAFGRVVNSPRRGIGDTSQGADRRPREHDRRADLRRRAHARGRPRPRRGGGQGGRALHGHDGEAARRARRASSVGDLLAGDARRLRLHRGARRPSARSRPRAGWRTSRSWSAWRGSTTSTADEPSVEEFLQQVALFSEQDDLTRRRGHRHADDAPQRQGPRVRHRLHDRDGGRRVPALALDRGGRHRGGAPALLRGRHAGAQGAVHDPRAHARAVRRPRVERAQPLPRRDPRRAHRRRRAAVGARRSPARGAARSGRAGPRSASSPGPAATSTSATT